MIIFNSSVTIYNALDIFFQFTISHIIYAFCPRNMYGVCLHFANHHLLFVFSPIHQKWQARYTRAGERVTSLLNLKRSWTTRVYHESPAALVKKKSPVSKMKVDNNDCRLQSCRTGRCRKEMERCIEPKFQCQSHMICREAQSLWQWWCTLRWLLANVCYTYGNRIFIHAQPLPLKHHDKIGTFMTLMITMR